MKKILILFLTIIFAQNCFAATVFSSSGLYGLKDDNNEVILKAQYSEITQLKYTPPKTVLIPMKATNEVKTVETKYYKIKKNGKYGIANSEGRIIHEIKYDDVKLNEYGGIVLIKDGAEILANPIKNSVKATAKTAESIVGLPVTIVAGVMIPIEMLSKIGRK